jgi:ribosomal protein S18 acetylase RimI-like enzyme
MCSGIRQVLKGSTCIYTSIDRKLMASLEDLAGSRGATRMGLLADRSNFSALDFYDKIGWHPTQLICLRRQWKKRHNHNP